MIWAFAGALDVKNRRTFESFAINVNNVNSKTKNAAKTSLFDLVFNFDVLQWVPLSDLAETNKVTVSNNSVIVLTEDYLRYGKMLNLCLDYHMNQPTESFNFTLVGESSTFKSLLLKQVSQDSTAVHTVLNLPLTAYLSLKNYKSDINRAFGGSNK